MFQAFLNYLNQRLPLNETEQDMLRQTLEVKKYPKGALLLAEGQISKAFFFNLSGMVRLFYLKDGVEKTTYFYPEATFISAYESFIRQSPAKFSFQAVEETEVVVISQEAAASLLAFSPKMEALARIAMEEELMANQKIIESLLTLSPEQRYDQLLRENPGIFQRVPQIHIASYLGVQPESLSRIKKRWLSRKS